MTSFFETPWYDVSTGGGYADMARHVPTKRGVISVISISVIFLRGIRGGYRGRIVLRPYIVNRYAITLHGNNLALECIF